MRQLTVMGLSAVLMSAAAACAEGTSAPSGGGSGGTAEQSGSGPGAGGDGGSGDGGSGGNGGSGGASVCGNGVLESGEVCDTDAFGGETCESLGHGPGTLACSASCKFNVLGCDPAPGCANGKLDPGEVCDGAHLGGATCANSGFDGGTLTCDARCQLDTGGCCDSGCTASTAQCQDNTLETCGLGPSGCYEWKVSQDCTTSGSLCDASSMGCIGPGEGCGTAIQLGAATTPTQVMGTFDGDPAVGGSCSGSPKNAVWFAFTAAESGMHVISAQNFTSTDAYSRLAVFQSTSCSPLGAELACDAVDDTAISADANLTMGETYLVLFHTDGNAYTMVDPKIAIAPKSLDGTACEHAVDVTGESFPFQLTGNFKDDPAAAGSCDATPTNAVWFSYTAPATADYLITAQNFTSTFAYSRLAVFASAACAPLGTELACVTETGKSASTTLGLTQGSTYTVAFFTDGDQYTMVDPAITIVEFSDGGNDCSAPLPLQSGTYSWQFATNNFTTGSPSCTEDTANGVDRVHEITLSAGAKLTVTLTPSSGDASIYLLTDCAQSATSCVAGKDAVASGPETLVYTAPSAGTYYFVADRYTSSSTSATYTLAVSVE